MERRRAGRLVVGMLFPLFFVGVLAAAAVYHRPIIDFFMSTESIERWVGGLWQGIFAPHVNRRGAPRRP